MNATVTIKDLSDQFWNGFGELIPAFLSQSPIDQFQRLEKLSHEMPKNVSLKIGNGAFRDRMEWVREIASNPQNLTSKVEPRRGYKLVTFELDGKNPAHRPKESPLYVKYLSLMKGEEPFMMQGTKYEYVWAEYPGGIKDIGVYSYAGDLVYSYDSFRKMMNLDRTNPVHSRNPKQRIGISLSKNRKRNPVYDTGSDE